MLTLNCLKNWLGYDGPRRFHIADGGSPQEEIDHYKMILSDYDVSVSVTDNLSDMVNSIARSAGELWMVVLDDFCPRYQMNVTPDAKILLTHEEIGVIRMARLNHWGSESGEPETSADLIGMNQQHWWRLDKERSADKYMASIGFHMYHRRWWDAYGDIPACPPHEPGQSELLYNKLFRERSGPTVAVPMRFGQDSYEHKEPVWHFGLWRSDEYTQTAGKRL